MSGYAEEQDESTIVSGLKEALSVGTNKAIELVSQVDGYFGNEMIKILLPEKFEKIGNTLNIMMVCSTIP